MRCCSLEEKICPSGKPHKEENTKDNNSDLTLAFLNNYTKTSQEELKEAATNFHNIYISFVEAGFTAKQSMELLKTMLEVCMGVKK